MKHLSTILIVDDEPLGRETLEGLLIGQSYDLAFASNGQEALAKAAELIPDLILLDVMMPIMDGPATIRALQRINPQVKVIAASGLRTNEKATEIASLGIGSLLSKPYTAEELLNNLHEILSAQ